MTVETSKKIRPVKRFLTKVWFVLRRFRILLACVLALFTGLAVGYTYLGNQPFSEVWKWSTWKHLFDLIFINA